MPPRWRATKTGKQAKAYEQNGDEGSVLRGRGTRKEKGRTVSDNNKTKKKQTLYCEGLTRRARRWSYCKNDSVGRYAETRWEYSEFRTATSPQQRQEKRFCQSFALSQSTVEIRHRDWTTISKIGRSLKLRNGTDFKVMENQSRSERRT